METTKYHTSLAPTDEKLYLEINSSFPLIHFPSVSNLAFYDDIQYFA